MTKLILPGNPLFDETLAMTPPPDWRETANKHSGQYAFIMRSDSGLMMPCSMAELDEYIEGGEYEERLEAIGDEELLIEAFGDEDELSDYLEIFGNCYPNYSELEVIGSTY